MGPRLRPTKNKMATALSCLYLALACAVLFCPMARGVTRDQCNPLLNLGGLVFPEYTRRPMEHALHWSKAQIAKPAPDWNGTAVVGNPPSFKDLRLSDFKGKYLVFFFYPLDFDRVDEFKALNTNVVACSVDSKYTHLAWIKTPREQGGLGNLNIPLLSDITKQISRDYGVLLEDEGISLRGLFLIDKTGILRQITMNDLPVGRSVDETLRLIQAFQYTDEHGEVCPANWTPGGKTIVPEPEAAKLYFKQCNSSPDEL